MFIMSSGYGSLGVLPLLFFMFFFIMPAVRTLLSGFAGGAGALTQDEATQTRPRTTGLVPAPQQDPRVAFANAKRDFPGQLINFDTELGEAEEFGIDLDTAELASARTHLNKAFAGYAQHFQSDNPTSPNVQAQVDLVSKNLEQARRHLLLADPAKAPQVAAMDETKRLADAEAGKLAAARAKAEADLAAQMPTHGMFTPAGFGQPARRQTSIQLTPFGIMIGSF